MAMATKRNETEIARKSRAFASGFLDGLAAPAMLLSGAFEAKKIIRRSSLQGSWVRTGEFIRNAAGEYRRKSIKHGR